MTHMTTQSCRNVDTNKQNLSREKQHVSVYACMHTSRFRFYLRRFLKSSNRFLAEVVLQEMLGLNGVGKFSPQVD